MKGNKAGHGQ